MNHLHALSADMLHTRSADTSNYRALATRARRACTMKRNCQFCKLQCRLQCLGCVSAEGRLRAGQGEAYCSIHSHTAEKATVNSVRSFSLRVEASLSHATCPHCDVPRSKTGAQHGRQCGQYRRVDHRPSDPPIHLNFKHFLQQ